MTWFDVEINQMLRRMTILLAAALPTSALAAVCETRPQARAPAAATRYVFLVDTSASMEGAGGSAKIFQRVKATLLQFTKTSPPGTEVQISTFNEGVTGTRRFVLPADQAAFTTHVNGLRADGQKTYVNRALADTYRALRDETDVNTIFYVLTDGKDNETGSQRHLREFVRDYRLSRGEYDWLYYVTLGLATPADTRAALAPLPNTRLLSNAPGQLPTLSLVTIQPGRLELGNLQLAPDAQRDLKVTVQGTSPDLQFRVDSPDLERHGAFLNAQPNAAQASRLTSVTFSLRNAQNLPPGTYAATLCLSGPSTGIIQPGALPLTFAYHPQAQYELTRQGEDARTLARGEALTQTYQLHAANRWATAPVTFSAPDTPGLDISINGAPSAEVKPGGTVTLTVRNVGLTRNAPITVAPQVNAAGAQVNAAPPFTVTQPATFWERFGLWLILLVLVLVVLAAYLLEKQKSWGSVNSEHTPGKPKALRGETVDLAKLLGNPQLNGLTFKNRAGRPTIAAIPDGLVLSIGRSRLEAGDPLEHGEPMTAVRDGVEIDTLTYQKA